MCLVFKGWRINGKVGTGPDETEVSSRINLRPYPHDHDILTHRPDDDNIDAKIMEAVKARMPAGGEDADQAAAEAAGAKK